MSTLTPAIATSLQFRSAPSNVGKFASSHTKALGIVQITLGILSIIFYIPTIVYHFGMYIAGHGMWGGTFYIIAGGLTLGAAKRKNKCMIVASLTLSVIASAAASVQVFLGVWGGILVEVEAEWYDEDEGMTYAGRMAINVIIALFGLIAMIIGIVISSLSCKALCCSGTVQTEAPVQVTLEDGRVLTAIVLPTQIKDSVMLPRAHELIVTNEKKELI